VLRTVPLKPKHQKKLRASDRLGIRFQVPEQWIDFARMCKIRSGTKYISFEPYHYQTDLVDLIESRKFTCIAKTRQLGISELICNYFVWKALRNNGYVAVILSKNQSDTSALAKRVKKQLFPFIAQGLLRFETDNLTDIAISGGGRLLFRNSSPNGIRGVESVSDVLFDEWGFVEDAELIYEAVLPTLELVGDDARVILNSTPNGRVGHYWGLLASGNGTDDIDRHCKEVREGIGSAYRHWVDDGGWNKVVIHWKAHPVYSTVANYLENKRLQMKMSESGIQREYNLSFDDTNLNVFPYELIEFAAIGDYEKPDPSKRYYLGVDVSTIGDDYTVGLLVSEDGRRYNTAAMYRQRKASMERNLDGLGQLITDYKPMKVGIEVTGGVGQLYLEKLSTRFPGTVFIAIKTTGDTKPIMIERSIHAHEKRIITYPTGVISDEHKAYVRVDKRLEASSGNHDDTVMGLAFALAVSPFADNSFSTVDLMTLQELRNHAI